MPGDNIGQLRQFFLELPKKYDYKYSRVAALQLRRALYFAFSNGGQYLPNFFEEYSPDSIPSAWSQIHSLAPLKEDWILHDYPNRAAAHPNVPCSRLFRKNEPCYRCLTCGVDETCALCSECFVEADHIGHEVYILICSRDTSGVCDCGDAEAWYIHNRCKHHETSEVKEEDVPEDLKNAMFSTLECALDYVIDVMSTSTPSFIPTNNKTSIIDHSNCSGLSPARYGGIDENSTKYYLVLYNDQTKHFSDAVNRIKLATLKVSEFAEMVAKQAHKNGRAILLGSDDLEFLLQRKSIFEATGLYSCIRSYRDFFREEMCTEIVRWLDDIMKGPVAGNYKLAHKLLCKAFSCKWKEGVEPWDDLLSHYMPGTLQKNLIPILPNHPNQIRSDEHEFLWKSQDETVNEPEKVWDVDPLLCAECQYDPTFSSTNKEPIHGSRLQYLLLFDIRFWKDIRVLLHEIYVSVVVSNITYKSLLACQYAEIYPLIAEIYLVIDREPDWSFMCNLSVQLFTCPTNATMLSRHGELKKFLTVAYSYLTSGHVMLTTPSTETKVPVQLSSLKVRRWNQLFFDISYILQRNEDAKLFFQKDVVLQVAELMILFNGLPVIKRESVEHVEYETNEYPLYFNGVSIIAHFCKLITKSAVKLQDRKTVVSPAIQLILQRYLDLLCESCEKSDKTEKTDISFVNKLHDVHVLGMSQKVLEFRVDKDCMSFLHPLSTYLSYLIQESGITNPQDLVSLLCMVRLPEGVDSQGNDFKTNAINNKNNLWKIISDYSLRTIVLLSQIKVGFWVRNGYSARSQYHNYRNLGLREYGFARDLYLIQMFSILEDSNTAAATMLDRWGLIPWTNEQYTDYSVYDSTTLQFMLEECLNFFIILLETNDHLLGLVDKDINERKLRKDIIHYLCFKPHSYAELCAELPDHVTNDRRFEYILNKLADYVLPQGSTVHGRYKLKEEFYDEINPYYVHYTSNKRDDAEKLIRERMAKLHVISFADTYYEPKHIELVELYQNFPKFTVSLFFIQFLKSTLTFILKQTSDNIDIIANLSLHLIHICVNENFKNADDNFASLVFTELDVTNVSSEYQSIGSLLYLLLTSEAHSNLHSKIRAIFNRLQVHFPLRNQYLAQRFVHFNALVLHSNLKDTFKTNEFARKKKLAAERKAKILSAFKKQQLQFVEQNNMTDDVVSDAEMDDPSAFSWKFPEECCILCQMPGEEDDVFGILAYVADSSEFRNIPFDNKYWLYKAFSQDESLDKALPRPPPMSHHHRSRYNGGGAPPVENTTPADKCTAFFERTEKESVVGPGFPNNDPCSVMSHAVTTSCGHGMHLSCFKDHLLAMRKRLSHFTRTLPEDLSNREFICPLCKAVNNILIPVLSHSNNRALLHFTKPTEPNWHAPFEQFDKSNTSKWLKNYELVIYEEFKESTLETLANVHKQWFFENFSKTAKLERVFNGLHKTLSYITLSYFKENISTLLAHTIESVEISLRGVPHDLVGPNLIIYQLSHQVITTLRVWCEYKKYLITLKAKEPDMAEHFLGILKLLSSKEIFNIGNVDFFELLVAAVPLNSFGFGFNSILTMCFLGEILKNAFVLTVRVFAKVILDDDLSLLDLPMAANIDGSMAANAKGIFDKLKECGSDTIPKELTNHPNFGNVFYSMLLKCVVPFLRRSAIWAYVNAADDTGITTEYSEDINEADKLCDFLHIPKFAVMLERFLDPSTFEGKKFKGFVERMKLYSFLNVLTKSNLQIKYPAKIDLINLPVRMDFFFTKYLYPHTNNDVAYDPAICLFCAKVVQLQESVISLQKGECNLHCETECINDCGLFLLPKHGSILMMYKGNGSFHDAPYYDQHGELPKDARNDHPLHLHLPKYEEFIRNIWLQHNIPNFVTRKLESVVDIGGWDTL